MADKQKTTPAAGGRAAQEMNERFNYDEIVALVEPGSSVLDLGCGTGELLLRLITERGCKGRGVDIEEEMIQQCIRRGISVFQGDLDEGLKDYPSDSYDYVILNETLQMIREPNLLLREMARVGRRIIVNFPNFGYILNRVQLGLLGRMPENKNIPYKWYNTPNIHFCTQRDFFALAEEVDLRVEKTIYLHRGKRIPPILPNLFATEVCCVLGGQVV
ncbi:MAG: methionine biosynthesis protein MetW [Alkalispirochaetaceae bacterium]